MDENRWWTRVLMIEGRRTAWIGLERAMHFVNYFTARRFEHCGSTVEVGDQLAGGRLGGAIDLLSHSVDTNHRRSCTQYGA